MKVVTKTAKLEMVVTVESLWKMVWGESSHGMEWALWHEVMEQKTSYSVIWN